MCLFLKINNETEKVYQTTVPKLAFVKKPVPALFKPGNSPSLMAMMTLMMVVMMVMMTMMMVVMMLMMN